MKYNDFEILLKFIIFTICNDGRGKYNARNINKTKNIFLQKI